MYEQSLKTRYFLLIKNVNKVNTKRKRSEFVVVFVGNTITIMSGIRKKFSILQNIGIEGSTID